MTEPASATVIGAYYDGREIRSWTRDASGKRVWNARRAEHVCYLRTEDISEEMGSRLRKTTLVTGLTKEGVYSRISFRDRDTLYRACSPRVRMEDGRMGEGLFPSQRLATYEADLHPIRRWMLDARVKVGAPHRCYLDIEADSRVPIAKKEAARILCWTIGDDEGNYVTGVLEEDTDAAERELLLDLLYELEAYDQVVGWFLDDYDLPMIAARVERLRIHVEVKKWLWADHLPIFRRMNISSSKSGDEKQSMALDAVARSVAGEGKLDGASGAQSWEMWEAGGDERELLAQYNRRDVFLMIAIEKKTGYLDVHLALCQECGVLPDTRGANPLRYVDQFTLSVARERGERLPTSYGQPSDDNDQFVGAYVMDPSETGFLREVHVCDFASMYPSIIRSWNMSPETYLGNRTEQARPSYLLHAPVVERTVPEGACVAPNGAMFKTTVEGILPFVIGKILELRRYWTKKKASLPPETPEWIEADRRATAYKQAANAFYGVAGCVFFRLYMVEVAEAVTLGGQWMIKLVLTAAEARGIRGIYSDTDSGFARGCGVEAFRAFVVWCNDELFPGELQKRGTRTNELKLEYEKAHELMIMVGKKRYAARYLHYKGQEPNEKTAPEIKGLEYKRGDVVRLARQMQADMLDLALGGGVTGPRRMAADACCTELEPFVALVERWRSRVLTGAIVMEDVRLAKRLARGLDEYVGKKKKDGNDAAQPPHVEVAKKLRDRGITLQPGMKIEYFISDGTTKPATVTWAGDWTGECDRYHLWDELVWPPTMRVLEACFPGHPWKSYKARKDTKAALAALDGFAKALVAPPRRSARGEVPRSQLKLLG